MIDWLPRSQVSGLGLQQESGEVFPHRDGLCGYEWNWRYRRMRGGPDQLPVLSFARAACQFRCTSLSRIRKDRDQAARGCPAMAVESRSVPATISDNFRRAGQRNECLRGARRGIERAGSRESKFSPHDRHTAHHVGQFLSCRPTGGLAESAVGREGEFLRRRVLQTETHAFGNVGGGFDVIALYVDDSDGHVGSPFRDLENYFNFREFAARHLQMHFIHGQFEECREQRRIAPQTHRAALVIAETKMSGKAAPSENRLDGFGKDLNEAPRILAVRVAAHRRLIKCNLAAASMDQLL